MSMYTTAQLLAANEQKFKFDPLFLRLFFRESYPFTTEKVYLSQIPGLVNMALYVSPIVSGEVIRSRGGSTSEFTPGYVKPKHEVNPQMTLRRLPDEDPQNLADPAYRRRRIILQNMRDEELAIAQVEEMQAVSAVLKGKYTMTGEAFDPVEVDMGRSEANNITQSGGTEWSKRDKSTYDPTDDNARVMRFTNGSIQVSKGLNVSGRVNPSDYSNFDIRYVRDIRLGTRVVQGMQKGVTYEKSGHVITGLCLVGDADGDNSAVYRPVQKYINGTWFNVSQV
ncbi:major capsid protein E [Escherichia coli]|nr:major capsid protein E [Escherichia coli]